MKLKTSSKNVTQNETKYAYLSLILFFADECVPQTVTNGNVTQISDDNHPIKVWKVRCHSGFALIGTDRIKCRRNVMTSKFPICTRKFKI